MLMLNVSQKIMDKKWILHKVLSNGHVRMGFGGICVFYLKCRSQWKLSSWNSCGQTQKSGTSHGYKSRFSWIRLDGWRHLDIQNYRKMTGEVYKSVQADKSQLPFSACGSECFGILVSFSKYPSTCKFLWKSVSQCYDYRAADFQHVSLCQGNELVVFGKKVLVLHLPLTNDQITGKFLQLLEHICCLHPSILSFLSKQKKCVESSRFLTDNLFLSYVFPPKRILLLEQ